jgi:D-sedoheptulose 7-phosphate isomerase
MFHKAIKDSIALKEKILDDAVLFDTVTKSAEEICKALKKGNKVLFCGNGGSAADAQHLAAELSGRFYYDRDPLPAEALHVNTSFLTAVANDYSFDKVYERAVKGQGKKGDVLVGISTSGNSQNIINALKAATDLGLVTIGLTGETGGKMKDHCRYLINIPSNDTPRIQEAHILIGHIICEIVERTIFPK